MPQKEAKTFAQWQHDTRTERLTHIFKGAPEKINAVLEVTEKFLSLDNAQVHQLVTASKAAWGGQRNELNWAATNAAFEAFRNVMGWQWSSAFAGFLSSTCNDAWNPQWTADINTAWYTSYCAALAAIAKEFISEGPEGFTQAHYDTLVAPWDTVIGKVLQDA